LERDLAELFGCLCAEVTFEKLGQAGLNRLAWGKLVGKFVKGLAEHGRLTPFLSDVGKELLKRPATWASGVGAYKILKGEPIL